MFSSIKSKLFSVGGNKGAAEASSKPLSNLRKPQTTDSVTIQVIQKALNSSVASKHGKKDAHTVVVAEGFGSWLESVCFINDTTKQPELWWSVDMEKPHFKKPAP